ncbi:DUF1963 domain-containing protein [Streptomyces sp. NPDC057545]|uniref:DUF1963 domain-containing protein n=1 Tax=Streptomyces sp. NPDC057545 TaxID=3346164 RepID=UPI0036A73B4C
MEANLRTRIHELGRKQGIPEAVVEEALRHLRPSISLCEADGSSWQQGVRPAAMAGGLPRLPEGMEWPDSDHPHLATIDCAALPRDVLDIDLPQDGHLVLFSDFDDFDAPVLLHISAGTETTEQEPRIVDENWPIYEPVPLHPLVVWHIDNWDDIPGAREFTERNPSGANKMDMFVDDLGHLFNAPGFARIRLGGRTHYFQNPPEEDGLTHFITVFGDPFEKTSNLAFAGTREGISARRYEKLGYYLEA